MSSPKTLDQAIIQALCVGPLSEVKTRMKQSIREYLILKFQQAMFEHPLCEQVLQQLFESITEIHFKEPAQTIEEWKKK
jgi:hypothetical protein